MFKYPVIDTHIHMYSEKDLLEIERAAKIGEYSAYTLLSSSFAPQTAPGNLSIIWAKLKNRKEVYGYASLHPSEDEKIDGNDLLQQAKLYNRIGFDGIKMLDGKPSIRKNRVPLDDPSYDPLFSYLEEEQIPVLYHSNDPKEFWDASRIPAWARQMYLYNEEFPQKDQITKETVGILKRHPKLNLTIAHMFFLPNTNEYELACNLMETYPNFFMDLTPGWEMFGDMHKEAEKWKKYVEKYSNRLVYGTDMGGNKEDADRLLAMKRALETTEEFDVGEYTCFGLGLEDSSLKNIYRDTYLHRIQKGCPRQISMDEIEDYVKNIELRIGKYRNIDKDKALIEVNKFYGFIQEEVKKR